ncbi:choice-of-anchor D domain-containing protein [bacterium]|nr:choice-of-anchor D domain-containing protein [bacterium]
MSPRHVLSTILAATIFLGGIAGWCSGGLNVVGSASTVNAATKVLIEGNYAYVSQWKQDSNGTIIDNYGDLEIFDISSPKHPVKVGHLALTDAGRGLSKSGDLVYIATAWKGVTIVNVANKTNPTQVHVLDTPYIALDVWADGSILYVADAQTLRIYNVSTPTSPVLLSSYTTAYQTNGLWKVGNRLYVSDLQRFYLFDVTNPSSPQMKSSINYSGNSADWFRHVTVDGDYAYLASSSTGIKVIDVKTTTSISVVSTLDTAGQAFHVRKEGKYLYVADTSGGVAMVDVSVTTAPVQVATCSVPNHAYGLDLTSGLVYVADLAGGLKVLGTGPFISVTPASVNFGDVYVNEGPTTACTVTIRNIGMEDLMFTSESLQVVGTSEFYISNAPNIVDPIPYNQAVAVELKFDPEGEAGSRSASLKIWTNDSVSSVTQVSLTGNALAPHPIVSVSPSSIDFGTVAVDDGPTSGRTVTVRNTGTADLHFTSGTLEIVGSSEFYVSNSPNTSVPIPPGGSLPVLMGFNPSGSVGSRSATLRVHTDDPDTSIATVSLAGTAALGCIGLTGSASTVQTAIKVLVDGDYAYVSQWRQNGSGTIIDYVGDLQIFNISNPANPVAVGYLALPDAGRGLSKSGDLLYIATAWRGVTIVNVANKANPTQVYVLDTPNIALDVWVDGTTLYEADSGNGLRIYNVSTPTAPVLLGTFATSGQANGLCKVGNLLYMTSLYRLYVMDVTNPASPVQKSYVMYNGDYTDWFRHVTVDGNYAYVASSYTGIKVVNVSNPNSISVVGTYDTPGAAWHVDKRGDYLYVADGDSGIETLDVSTPGAPILFGSYNTPGSSMGLDVVGTTIYVADMTAGLQVLTFQSTQDICWVDFLYSGIENGSFEKPFNTVGEGVSRILPGGRIKMMGGHQAGAIRISKSSRLETHGSTSTIGK